MNRRQSPDGSPVKGESRIRSSARATSPDDPGSRPPASATRHRQRGDEHEHERPDAGVIDASALKCGVCARSLSHSPAPLSLHVSPRTVQTQIARKSAVASGPRRPSHTAGAAPPRRRRSADRGRTAGARSPTTYPLSLTIPALSRSISIACHVVHCMLLNTDLANDDKAHWAPAELVFGISSCIECELSESSELWGVRYTPTSLRQVHKRMPLLRHAGGAPPNRASPPSMDIHGESLQHACSVRRSASSCSCG